MFIVGLILFGLTLFWFCVFIFNLLEWIIQSGEGYFPFPKEWLLVFTIHVILLGLITSISYK